MTNKPAAGVSWRVLDGYHHDIGVYDEMLDGGDLRPHCEPLVRSLEALGRRELASRWERARRAVRDNGVTYNVHGDPQGMNRPWELDMMPLVIAPSEWCQLEAALVQRTRLFNQILADLYGPQRLLRSGLVPPELVFANPAFLRPCHGIPIPKQMYLHLHAIDLARSPAGQWRVLADHTQAPSGAGYALENRIVLSRSLPEVFRDCHVQRLASFFHALRDTVTAMAPPQRDDPRIVLLTPGPFSDTYFEHAYLARYLGFTLVEGGDLTVRDRQVFIKTLEGLEPVDVVFRRLDDSLCDPLELRSSSLLGTAGLVEAARAGHVTIGNALGSGALETVAIMAFLPDLCRELLGEPLALPSVTTWWCGQPKALQYVLEHLDHLVIKRTFPSSGNRQPIFGGGLASTEKAALAAEMRTRPAEFVAHDHGTPSTVPVWIGGRLEPRSLVLRAYVGAAGDSYAAMPGGLTRVSGARDASVVSLRRGGGSKDTWVIAERPVGGASLLSPAGSPTRHERRAADLPSRVADNLFWLGRHAERTEHSVRLVRSIVTRLAEEDTTADTSELVALRKVLVGMDLLPARLAAAMPLRDLEGDLLALLFRQGAQRGLRRMLNDVRRIAAAVRDRLSEDTWRVLNQLHQDFRLRHGRIQLDDVLVHLNRMMTDLAAFGGMMENTTRGHGWRFLDIGRRLERSINLTSLLSITLTSDPGEATAVLEPLLEIADSSMTYRRRYFATPQLSPVLDLLLADHVNARGLLFQLDVLTEQLHELPHDPRAPSPTTEERLIAEARQMVSDADIQGMCERGPDEQFSGLATLLASVEEDLRACSDAITYYYFSHVELRVS